MSILTSSELFINQKNPPKYDPNRHLFDQTKDVIQFYLEEYKKITEGVTIGGYYIHPWLYYHINFFKTPIPQIKTTGDLKVISEKVMNPHLDDNVLFVMESYMEAEENNKGMCMFGTRGFAKTTFLTSQAAWKNTTVPNGVMDITGGSKKDLGQIAKLYNINTSNINKAFYLPRLKTDWNEKLDLGVRFNNYETDVYSTLSITNAEGGSTEASSEKGAGGSPIGYIIDEIGKFNFKEVLEGAKPSFFFEGKSKLVWILSGTGGNETLSKDAREVLSNPADNDLVLMNWSRLDRSVPEEALTWDSSKSKPFSIFVPGQMCYRMPAEGEPAPKLDTTLGEYLGKGKDSVLNKIKMRKTDWIKATKSIESYVEKARRPDEKERRKSYYPLKTEHCFITSSHNPFPLSRINDRIEMLERTQHKERPVDILRDNGGWYRTEFSGKKKAETHHQGGIVDAPIMIYDNNIPEEKPPRYKYIGGHDGYKTAVSNTSSLGANCIVERGPISGSAYPTERLVAMYAARPDKIQDYCKTCVLMHDVWNAQINYENIDTAIEQYLEGLNRTDEVLGPYLSFAKSNNKKYGRTNQNHGKYGTTASKVSKDRWMALVINHAKEEHVVGRDDNDKDIIEFGVDYIDDIDLLKEMRDWTPDGNFDRLVAWGHALLLCKYYDNRQVTTEREKTKRQVISESEMIKKIKGMSSKYGGSKPKRDFRFKGSRY